MPRREIIGAPAIVRAEPEYVDLVEALNAGTLTAASGSAVIYAIRAGVIGQVAGVWVWKMRGVTVSVPRAHPLPAPTPTE